MATTSQRLTALEKAVAALDVRVKALEPVVPPPPPPPVDPPPPPMGSIGTVMPPTVVSTGAAINL